MAGDICTQLLKSDEVFCYLPKAHEKEHCLEVELPFLQERLHDMPSIVPVVVGTQDIEKLRRVAEALQPYFTAENLFVISSDYSNYMDPESMGNLYSTPIPKSVTFNLNLNF